MTTSAQVAVMRVLDLGCGNGRSAVLGELPEFAEITGLDISRHPDFPASRKFVLGRGEDLPFDDASFDAVVSAIALPYMNIPVALGECYRVLRPGGEIRLTLHPFRFTWHELVESFPRPLAMLYRLLVMANGISFHLTGRAFGESFQTWQGMRIALYRAGFRNLYFSEPMGKFGPRMKALARKPAIRLRQTP